MAKFRYQLIRSDIRDEWSRKMTLTDMKQQLSQQLERAEGPYRKRDVQPKNGEFGQQRTRKGVMRRVTLWAHAAKDGSQVAVMAKNYSGPTYRIRKVKVAQTEREPNFSAGYNYRDVNVRLQEMIRHAAGFDYGVRSNGLAYTRYIAGTSTLSQHSRWRQDGCKGNAADLYFPLPLPVGNDLPRQRRLVAFLRGRAPDLSLNMIISERTYWSRSSGWGPRYYSGIAHVSHTHIEAYPTRAYSPCW
jgi:hypothetical protein